MHAARVTEAKKLLRSSSLKFESSYLVAVSRGERNFSVS